jgi:hypothetical protein
MLFGWILVFVLEYRSHVEFARLVIPDVLTKALPLWSLCEFILCDISTGMNTM